MFYDRPFDNLWENVRDNNFVLPLLNCRQARPISGARFHSSPDVPGTNTGQHIPRSDFGRSESPERTRLKLLCRSAAEDHGQPLARSERPGVLRTRADHHGRDQPRFLHGSRPIQQQSAGHRLSRQSGIFRLQCPDCGCSLSDSRAACAGNLHLEPLHRQPERSAHRRLFQFDVHQHSDRVKRRSDAPRFPSSSTRTPIAAIRTSISGRIW